MSLEGKNVRAGKPPVTDVDLQDLHKVSCQPEPEPLQPADLMIHKQLYSDLFNVISLMTLDFLLKLNDWNECFLICLLCGYVIILQIQIQR